MFKGYNFEPLFIKCANLINTSEFKNKFKRMLANHIEELKKYLEDDPGDTFTLYALALELVKIESYAEAQTIFSGLVEKYPDYLPAYYQYGKLSEKMNDFTKANETYIKGIELAKKKNDLKTMNEIKEAFNLLNGIEED
jgi:tetratricopeptide (TPR) repeat protein